MSPLQHEVSAIFLREAQQNQLPWQHSSYTPKNKPMLLPKNPGTGKDFSALNTLLLWKAAAAENYASPLWASADHWMSQGEIIREGQGSTKLFHFEESARRSLGWTTHVYNRCQLASYDANKPSPPKPKALSTRAADAKAFIQSTGVIIVEREGAVSYLPQADAIHTPPLKSLHKKPTPEEEERHTCQLLFPLMHWTGHASRCNRPLPGPIFGKDQIFECLVALIGSTMLAAQLQITDASRIGGCDFMRALEEELTRDKRFFIRAAVAADAGIGFLNGFKTNARLMLAPSAANELPKTSQPSQVIALQPSVAPHFRA